MIHVQTLRMTIPGVRPRRFLHISDAHIAYAYPDDPPEVIANSAHDTARWGTEGRTSNENFEDFLALARETKPDALVISGDLYDYYQPSSARYLLEKLGGLPVEYLFVYGNHEPAAPAANGLEGEVRKAVFDARLAGPAPEFWIKDYGDLLLIGLNDAYQQIPAAQLDRLEEQMARGIPIFLVMHIPLPFPNFLATTKIRQPNAPWDYNYFLLGCEKPNESTDRLYRLASAPDSPIAGILAGHVHFFGSDEYAPGKWQLTPAPGYGWDVRINWPENA
jgi:hypothetical protein